MSTPTYLTIVSELFTELNLILKDYTFNVYQTLEAHLRAPLGLAVVLFITLMGFSITLGYSKLEMQTFTRAAIKIGIVYTLGMNWGYFSQYFVDGISKSAGQIGDWIVSASPIHIPSIGGTGINGAMQTVLIEVVKVASWVWDKASWHFLSPYFTSLMIWIFGGAMIIIGIFEIAMAKIMLALLFATAPLFFVFTIFSYTRSWFDKWLGAIAGFAFLIIFVSGILGLALTLMQWAIGGIYIDHALHLSVVGFVSITIVGFLCLGILLKSAQLAQSIGGTVTTSSGTGMLAAGIGGFLGGAMGAANHAKNLANLATKGMGGAMNVGERLLNFASGGQGLWKEAKSSLQSGAGASSSTSSPRQPSINNNKNLEKSTIATDSSHNKTAHQSNGKNS